MSYYKSKYDSGASERFQLRLKINKIQSRYFWLKIVFWFPLNLSALISWVTYFMPKPKHLRRNLGWLITLILILSTTIITSHQSWLDADYSNAGDWNDLTSGLRFKCDEINLMMTLILKLLHLYFICNESNLFRCKKLLHYDKYSEEGPSFHSQRMLLGHYHIATS